MGPRGVNPVKPPKLSGYTGVFSRKVSVCTAGAEEEAGGGEDGEEDEDGGKDGEETEEEEPGLHCQ